MVLIFPLKAIFKFFHFDGSFWISIVLSMPLESNLFICWVCKWDINQRSVRQYIVLPLFSFPLFPISFSLSLSLSLSLTLSICLSRSLSLSLSFYLYFFLYLHFSPFAPPPLHSHLFPFLFLHSHSTFLFVSLRLTARPYPGDIPGDDEDGYDARIPFSEVCHSAFIDNEPKYDVGFVNYMVDSICPFVSDDDEEGSGEGSVYWSGYGLQILTLEDLGMLVTCWWWR